jgi:hypothetical protein
VEFAFPDGRGFLDLPPGFSYSEKDGPRASGKVFRYRLADGRGFHTLRAASERDFMTLIIAAICRDGAAVLADRRSHIVENGAVRFDDEYGKIIRRPGYLLCNHGYNRIDDRDWKISEKRLEMDYGLPVYEGISSEMRNKSFKFAGYVFAMPRQFVEITISAGEQPRLNSVPPHHDRLVCGSGKDLVDLSPLNDLARKSMEETAAAMEAVFLAAFKRQSASGGSFFSEAYDIETLYG